METPVYLEAGKKRVFACALDWPGWCRSGKNEADALETLAATAPRYGIVAAEAGLPFPRDPDFTIVERLQGSGATDFGVPEKAVTRDREPISTDEASRLASLVAASWAVFARVVERAPRELRKGPRGGGRDRDAIVDHVLGAEAGYARMIGLPPGQRDRDGILLALRRAELPPETGRKLWPIPYAARRIAWHVLDHAWEIEDKGAGIPHVGQAPSPAKPPLSLS